MVMFVSQIKGGVAAICAATLFLTAPPVVAQDDTAPQIDPQTVPQAEQAGPRSEAQLLEALRDADPRDAQRIEAELANLWSASGSDSMDFLLKRGRDAIEVQNWTRAIEHLTALTDHAPDFAEGYYTRALAFFRIERFGPAMADLERALALNPNHFAALRGVASILEVLDEPDRALAAYEMVLQMHPNDSEARAGAERMRLASEGQTL